MIQNCIEGQVASINDAGDLVTDISCQRIQGIGDARQAKIKVGDHETVGIFPIDHGEPDGTLITIEGSPDSWRLESVA